MPGVWGQRLKSQQNCSRLGFGEGQATGDPMAMWIGKAESNIGRLRKDRVINLLADSRSNGRTLYEPVIMEREKGLLPGRNGGYSRHAPFVAYIERCIAGVVCRLFPGWRVIFPIGRPRRCVLFALSAVLPIAVRRRKGASPYARLLVLMSRRSSDRAVRWMPVDLADHENLGPIGGVAWRTALKFGLPPPALTAAGEGHSIPAEIRVELVHDSHQRAWTLPFWLIE